MKLAKRIVALYRSGAVKTFENIDSVCKHFDLSRSRVYNFINTGEPLRNRGEHVFFDYELEFGK